MPRIPRVAPGGIVYHVLNRAVGRGTIFDDDADYLAMERVIDRTYEKSASSPTASCPTTGT